MKRHSIEVTCVHTSNNNKILKYIHSTLTKNMFKHFCDRRKEFKKCVSGTCISFFSGAI